MCNVVRRRATNFENSVFQFADRMSGSSFIVKRFSGFGVRLMILGVTTIPPLKTPNPGDTRERKTALAKNVKHNLPDSRAMSKKCNLNSTRVHTVRGFGFAPACRLQSFRYSQ